jgi:hypothetical protein
MSASISILRSCVVLLLLGAQMASAVNTEMPDADPDTAWKKYARGETAIRPTYQFPYASCFRAASVDYHVPETLLLAVARGESNFEETARSKANAHGVMQIQWPGTARHLGINRLSDLYDPCTNIDAGARYLKELMGRYNGDIHLALAAYNYGPGRISTNGGDIPEGAEWYSSYIYRHLAYVLGDRSNQDDAVATLYSTLGQTTLLSFGEPYRAAAFVTGLEVRAPGLQLDWFRKGVGEFVVVLTYGNKDEYHSGAAQLANAGFPLD